MHSSSKCCAPAGENGVEHAKISVAMPSAGMVKASTKTAVAVSLQGIKHMTASLQRPKKFTVAA